MLLACCFPSRRQGSEELRGNLGCRPAPTADFTSPVPLKSILQEPRVGTEWWEDGRASSRSSMLMKANSSPVRRAPGFSPSILSGREADASGGERKDHQGLGKCEFWGEWGCEEAVGGSRAPSPAKCQPRCPSHPQCHHIESSSPGSVGACRGLSAPLRLPLHPSVFHTGAATQMRISPLL